jgi:nucleotide-binding universal stress UspA family protein
MQHVLVATDLSPLADIALDRAVAFAARDKARLTLVFVSPDYTGTPVMGNLETSAAMEWNNVAEAERANDETELRARCERAGAAGVTCDFVIRQGHVDEAIALTATELGVDLVVLGTHGRTGITRFLLGSQAEHIARRSPVSALVVRAPREGGGPEAAGPDYTRILVGTDFSPACEKALREAIKLSAPGALIEIAHVWQYPPGTWGMEALADKTGAMGALRDAVTAGATERGQQLVEQYGDQGRTLRFQLLHGPTASVLTTRAESEKFDLIAVGTHGRRGFRRFLLGSVAEAAMRHAHCSVLIGHAEVVK